MHLLIDANNIVGRFFSANGPSGIGDSVASHIERCSGSLGCTDVVIAWDDETTFRHRMFPEYKGKREPREGIDEAREEVKRALLELGYRSVYSPDHEADDALATLAVNNAVKGVKSIIYSGDRDLHQMLCKGLVSQLLSFRTSYGEREYRWRTFDGVHGVAEKFGVTAEQWVDYRCLTGDSSDNIDGFPGIGPKRAVELLGKWGSIDEYYRAPLSFFVQKSVSRSMSKGKAKLGFTRQLISLVQDAPIVEMDAPAFAPKGIEKDFPF
jgi:DNA polymerase-1